jgi:hypothetical protein
MKTTTMLATALLTGCFSDAPFEGSGPAGEAGASDSDTSSGEEGETSSGSGSGSASGSGSGDGSGSSEASESGEWTGGGTSGSGSTSSGGTSGSGTSSGTSGTSGSSDSETGGDTEGSEESSDSGVIEPDMPVEPSCADNCAVAFDEGSGRTGDTSLFREALSDTVTVEIWFRRTGDVFNEYMFDTRNAEGQRGMAIYQGNGALTFEVFVIGLTTPCKVEAPSLNTLEVGRWHHLLVQSDGSELAGAASIYVNGYREAFLNGSPNDTCGITQQDTPIRVGEAFDGSSRLSSLEIDNIRINSGSSIAYDGFSPDPTPVVMGQTRALWYFDEGSGDVAADEVSGLELHLSNHRWVNH